MPAPIESWLLLAIGSSLLLTGLALTAWALFADRPRGRRRCPRCAYAMAGTPGLTCPECGHTAPAEQHLFRTRRRWRIALAATPLIVIGGLFLAHIKVREVQGGWWNAAPTALLIPLLTNEYLSSRAPGPPQYFVHGPRGALWQRLRSSDPRSTLADPDSLSARNWHRVADACRSIILDFNRSRDAHSWASITLGCIIPDDDLVDPIIRELLEHPNCRVREVMLGGAYPYYLQRLYFSEHWIDSLVRIACDPACPTEAATAASMLARTDPLPVDHLRRIIDCISDDPALANVWQGLQSGLSSTGHKASPVEDRLAFIASLESNDDPAIREQAAVLRSAVENAWRPPGQIADDERR